MHDVVMHDLAMMHDDVMMMHDNVMMHDVVMGFRLDGFFGSGYMSHDRRKSECRRKERSCNKFLHHRENLFIGRTPPMRHSRPNSHYRKVSINLI
jgi:hypothetical protein